MTGTHSGPQTGHRSGRSWAWRIGTPLVALLSGSLLAVSAANSDGTDLRPGRYTDLAGLVEGEAADYRGVEDRFNALTEEVDRLGAGVSDLGVNRARGEVAELRDPAGLTPRQGPGLRITMADAPSELVDEAIERNRDAEPEDRISLNRYVVHQQDIQAVVNALWTGGASAFSRCIRAMASAVSPFGRLAAAGRGEAPAPRACFNAAEAPGWSARAWEMRRRWSGDSAVAGTSGSGSRLSISADCDSCRASSSSMAL